MDKFTFFYFFRAVMAKYFIMYTAYELHSATYDIKMASVILI
jgi:hypothetical protein